MKMINNYLYIVVLFTSLFFVNACAYTNSKEGSQSTEAIAELKNTYWKILSIQGNPVVSVEGERELFMQLRFDDSLKGFAGCNAIMGSYTTKMRTLIFSNVASTRKYCAPAMDQEQAYLQALVLVIMFEIKGEHLYLYDQNDQLMFDLESVYLK